MSLSRSPSPHRGGGWSSPGLIPGSGRSSPRGFSPMTRGVKSVSWTAAKAKSDELHKYPSFATRSDGFFSRQKRKISAPIVQLYRQSPLSGGSKFVIILASNVEGGVMEWKGAREWAVERNSIRNKREYARKWGYKLEVANMLAKKRYSHEWRESWEKVDVIREIMRKNPQAEWFWWLDLNTWIMEYGTSLQSHIFDNIDSHVYRDINEYNPLNITHPPPQFYLDELARAPTGDGDASSLHLLLSQDCSGFSLGSFFLRRSVWTERLLDAWWDPVMYEQMHSQWPHKEQSALEYIYQSQPWTRSGIGFLPQRRINSFPLGACGDDNDPAFHYQEADRDFVVNMASCMLGRDCWSEIYTYRAISNDLNRSPWDGVSEQIRGVRAKIFGAPDEVD
ncbi:Mannan polymerase II complex MNN10 subunit [Penicillium ucsense]|uniref:Mannan polymerase II complex MNN10 subunit n=1 Tax=Penicillium ucsense TaxID=2839758 RepID=A0A8J8W7A0_9EURO|nr:Mannan polymerase II complex MNN10 subunit [Penicillium ucsense]KAF7737087.1 Mannan polymerase II complex MNN10 subunit [Penicillium ucsense]